ncbi:MAG: hypothetical protein IPO92_09740 [Saprospiraceae bacterium]|nr:hypothetical protein [Saprospiraceae bacterium]
MKFCSFLQFSILFIILSSQSGLCYTIDSPVAGRTLKIRVYLEGALLNNTGETADGRLLMRDNLRVSPFNGNNYIPVNDPYQTTLNMVNLSIHNKHVGMGSLPSLSTISDPVTVFGVTGRNAIVDWVFVEIRSSTDNTLVIATRSGLLQRDGDVVDMDGVSDLNFPDLNATSFYAMIRHRNHLGVMTMIIDGNSLIDFSNPATPVFDFGTTLFPMFNYTGMARNENFGTIAPLWAGDFNSDLALKLDPPSDDHNIMFIEVETYALPGLKLLVQMDIFRVTTI